MCFDAISRYSSRICFHSIKLVSIEHLRLYDWYKTPHRLRMRAKDKNNKNLKLDAENHTSLNPELKSNAFILHRFQLKLIIWHLSICIGIRAHTETICHSSHYSAISITNAHPLNVTPASLE